MKLGWKKVLGTTAVLAFGALITALSGKNNDELSDWLKNASDDELSKGYDERRREWARTGFGGNGEKTSEMKKINNEINRRSAEKWEKDPRRNTNPNFRWTDKNRWEKD